jgi:hypothetical protein
MAHRIARLGKALMMPLKLDGSGIERLALRFPPTHLPSAVALTISPLDRSQGSN